MFMEHLNDCTSRLTKLLLDNPEINRLDAYSFDKGIKYKVLIYRVLKVIRIDIKEV